MERVVKVTVDAAGGIHPSAAQYAGVQGEHNACRVVFDVTAWAAEPFSYRGEFVSGDGAGGTTALLNVEDGCTSFLLPAAWTAAGGRAVARLVAAVTVEGEETQTVFAVDVPLYFAAKQECDRTAQEQAWGGLTALAETVQGAVDDLHDKLADGSLVGPPGPQGVSGVFVGSGDMPAGYNVQIDPDGDTEKPWVPFADVELTEAVAYCDFIPDGEYSEIYIEGRYVVETAETAAKSVMFGVGRNSNYITRNTVSVSNGSIVHHRAWGRISPSKKMLFESVAGTARFANVAGNCGDPTVTEVESFDKNHSIRIATNSPTTHWFGAGSTVKIWGRV